MVISTKTAKHICNDTKFLDHQVFRQTGLGKRCRPRSDCSSRSSLTRVFTVRYSICIFLTKYSKVWPVCSNFRLITAKFYDVQKFRKFTVADPNHSDQSLYCCIIWLCLYCHMSRVVRKPAFCIYAKTKAQISFAVIAKLISAFVFALRIVQFLYYLNPKFQASSHFVWLYSPV